MRVSQQLTTTLREVPRDSEGGNQELLVQGGFISAAQGRSSADRS